MAVTTEQVAELYVSFFNRAPDAAGLAYWVESGLAIEEISQSFFDQEETKTTYPDTMSDAEFIDTIYLNMYNRHGDPDGITYWANELATGSITRANMILAIGNGAQDTDTSKDQTILDNKTEVGLYYANAGLNDVDKATDVMSGVNDTEESVTSAKKLTDTYTSLDLTIDKDTIIGTDNDDTIGGLLSASGSTYTAGDSVDGGEGTDTFNIINTGGSDAIGTLTNVEAVALTATAVTTLSAVNWGNIESYELKSVGSLAHQFTEVSSLFTSLKVNGVSAAATETFDFLSSVEDGNNDALDVTVENSGAVLTLATQQNDSNTDIIESLTIHSQNNSAGAGFALAQDRDVTSITVDGNSQFALTTTGSRIADVDASGLNSVFEYTSASSVEDMTIKGAKSGNIITAGSGNDTIYGSEENDDASVLDGSGAAGTGLKGGAGNDTIYGLGGKDIIVDGAGNDTIYGGAGKDSITVGAGNDTVKYSAASESGLTTDTADVLTGFATGTDHLSFRDGVAGSTSNFVASTTTGITTVDMAVEAANNGELSGKNYLNIGNFLVADFDADGQADLAINVGGSIDALDIIAWS